MPEQDDTLDALRCAWEKLEHDAQQHPDDPERRAAAWLAWVQYERAMLAGRVEK